MHKEESAEMSRQDELRELLVSCRSAIRPEDKGLAARSGRGPRATGLSQEQVDLLTVRARKTYHKLENSSWKALPTQEYVEQVARLLEMTEDQWRRFWTLVFGDGTMPTHVLNAEIGMDVNSGWEKVVDEQQSPAYITNIQWDLTYYNQQFVSLLPSRRPPSNMMHWMLFAEEARGPGGVLADWETMWAPFVLPQLEAAYRLNPHFQTLADLRRKAMADSRTATIFGRGTSAFSISRPDGEFRPILHPLRGSGIVSLHVAEPLGHPGARIVIVRFQPRGC